MLVRSVAATAVRVPVIPYSVITTSMSTVPASIGHVTTPGATSIPAPVT